MNESTEPLPSPTPSETVTLSDPPSPEPPEAPAAATGEPDAAPSPAPHDADATTDVAASPPIETPLLAPTEPVTPTRSAAAIESVHAAVSVAEALSMGLSPAQRTAIEKLTTGHTLIASATAAGVSRVTLHRWLKHDLTFLAAYNAWQHDAIATTRARLLALTDSAVTSVQNSILKGDGRLALNLLTRLGLTSPPTPGSTELADLEAEAALTLQRQEIEKRKEADRVAWEGILHPPTFPEPEEQPEPEPIRVRYKRLE